MKKWFCVVLVVVFCCYSCFALAATNKFDGTTITVNNGKKYYKAWSQDMYPWRDDMPYSSSTSDWMNRYGCCVVAMAKMIVEAGLQDPDTFNPGTLISTYGTSATKLITGDGPSRSVPTKYGFTYEGAIKTNSSDVNGQVLELLKSDTYYYGLILFVNTGSGTHFVHVDREKTLEKGTVYINDSMSHDKGKPTGNTRFSDANDYWNKMAEVKLSYTPIEIRKYRLPLNSTAIKFPYSIVHYERAIYKGDGSNDNYVKEYPYSGSDVANLEENYKDKEFVVTCAVKNKHGNIWYKVEGGGYIYSGDVTYVSSCPTFNISGEQSPSGSLTKGNPFYNKAVIESSDSLMKVTSAIYQDNTVVQGPYVANISSSIQKSYTINASSDLAKKLTFGSLENGNYTYKVTVWYGKHGLSKDVISTDFTIGSGTTVEMCSLDLSAHKDGVEQLTLEGVGTVDVYINGKLVADDVTDYSAKHPVGTDYSITDIKAINNFEYNGAYVGPLSGTIGQYDVELVLMFEPVYPLVSVSAVVDGVAMDSLEGIATFDVIVNNKTQGNDITSYAERWAPGYAYSITDIQTVNGYEYNGCNSGNLSGTTCESNSQVVLIFESNLLDIAWTYADRLPNNISSDDYEIQYQNVFYRDQTTSPGSEWSLIGSVGTEYVNSGDVYTSFYQLDTSETRVLNKFDYYHICGPSTENGIWFEHTSSYIHTDIILDSSTVNVAGTYSSDADSNLKYYKLKWNDGSLAYCGDGTCSTTHAKRSCYWYRRHYYQDKTAVTTNRYVKHGVWQDQVDSTANDYQVRYRPKNGIITSIELPQIVYELKVGQESSLHFGTFSFEGNVENPSFYWTVDNTDIASITQLGIKGHKPGITFLYCTAEEKYGGCSAVAMIVVSDNESISLPSKVYYIEEEAFESIPIHEIDFRGTSIGTIESKAFAYCTNLKLVFLPNTLQSIASDAFEGCPNVTFVCESFNFAAQYAENHNIPFFCLDFDPSLMN